MRAVQVVAVAVALSVVPLCAHADLMYDPGFEGVGSSTNWQSNVSVPGFTIDFDSTAEAHSGSESFMVSWSTDIPAWNIAEAYQQHAVTEGVPFSASVYAKVTTELDNPCFSYLETIFFDSLNGEVGAHLQSTKLYQVADWTLLSNDGTVPENAVSARVRLVTFNEDGISSSGTVYWDDASADVTIPEPTTCLLLGVGIAGLITWRRRHV